jgi:hypothetical protein
MVRGESSRGENPEAENPEQAVSNAVATIENRDAVEPNASSKAVQNAKEWAVNKSKTSGKFAFDATRVGIFIAAKMVWGVLKFAQKAIEKKGQVGFKEGYEIGKEALSFDGKKDKK